MGGWEEGGSSPLLLLVFSWGREEGRFGREDLVGVGGWVGGWVGDRKEKERDELGGRWEGGWVGG